MPAVPTSNLKPGSRVAFVMPYIGKWPAWSGLFFLSCRANPCVTILLLCETGPDLPLPPNVVVIRTTLTQMRQRLEKATGLRLPHLSGHKLCDFRPFFGLAFADLLAGYEFWGFCDPDIMLGDVARLLTDQFLDSVDVFTAHDTQCAGHFTILRNVRPVNEACFQMSGWQELCAHPLTRLVEERLLPVALAATPALRIARPLPLPQELERPFGRVGITFDFHGRVAYLDQLDMPLVTWRDGRVHYHSQTGRATEVLYVHFMGLKRWWHWVGFAESSVRKGIHCFSQIGYGCVSRPEQLSRFPWTMWYAVQRLLGGVKSASGNLIRSLVPTTVFLRLRRLIFGSGRY